MVWTSNKWRRKRSIAGVRAHLEHQNWIPAKQAPRLLLLNEL